jgi:hypothetical protein
MTKYTYKEKLELIDALVNNDFCADMENKRYSPYTFVKWREKDGDQMADILAKVYMISHTLRCKSCDKQLKINKLMEEHRDQITN